MLLTRKAQIKYAQDLVLGLRRQSDGKVLNIPICDLISNETISDRTISDEDNVDVESMDNRIIESHSINKSTNYNQRLLASQDRFNLDFLKVEINIYIKIGLVSVMLMGIFVGISASIFSLMDLFDPNTFIAPCYVKDCNVGD